MVLSQSHWIAMLLEFKLLFTWVLNAFITHYTSVYTKCCFSCLVVFHSVIYKASSFFQLLWVWNSLSCSVWLVTGMALGSCSSTWRSPAWCLAQPLCTALATLSDVCQTAKEQNGKQAMGGCCASACVKRTSMGLWKLWKNVNHK